MGSGALTGQTIGHYVVLESLGRAAWASSTRPGTRGSAAWLPSRSCAPTRWATPTATAAVRCARPRPPPPSTTPTSSPSTRSTPTPASTTSPWSYVEGGTLADLIASGPLPAERALRLAAQVADALAVAHAASIVHRDLKPSNIMMPAEDRVKVVDFGLAKLVGRRRRRRRKRSTPSPPPAPIVGTAPYMSPEQAAGRAVDARSDLFSLGTILYEMLAGRRPFARRLWRSARWRRSSRTRRRRSRDSGRRGAARRALPAQGPRPTVPVRRRAEGGDRGRASPRSAAASRPSVAVLPFTNMSGVKEDDYLCEGLAEEIIDALTRIPGCASSPAPRRSRSAAWGSTSARPGRDSMSATSSRAACGGPARGCA